MDTPKTSVKKVKSNTCDLRSAVEGKKVKHLYKTRSRITDPATGELVYEAQKCCWCGQSKWESGVNTMLVDG